MEESTKITKTSVKIDGEEVELDAVKDPRLGKIGQWHARGVYKKKYITAQGEGILAAFENWEAKARAMSPSEQAQPEEKESAS